MPPMCRSCPDVNKLWGMDTTILGQHRPFMSIKSTQRVTRDGVPMLANPFNWLVRWLRPARVPLFSLGLKVPRSPFGHSKSIWLVIAHVGLETRYIYIGKTILIIDRNFYIDLYNLRQHYLRRMPAHSQQENIMMIIDRMHTWQQCSVTISEDVLTTKCGFNLRYISLLSIGNNIITIAGDWSQSSVSRMREIGPRNHQVGTQAGSLPYASATLSCTIQKGPRKQS